MLPQGRITVVRDPAAATLGSFPVREEWMSMRLDPLVSVIVPLRTDEPMLRATVASILRQSLSNLELLIVRTSESPVVEVDLEDDRIRCVDSGENDPTAWTLVNVGAPLARGAWLAFAEPGAIWSPDHLWMAIRAAERAGSQAATSAVMASEPISMVWASDRQPTPKVIKTADVMDGTPMGLSTLLCDAGLFREVTEIPSTGHVHSVLDLLLKLSFSTPVVQSGTTVIGQADPGIGTSGWDLDPGVRLDTYREFLRWLQLRDRVVGPSM